MYYNKTLKKEEKESHRFFDILFVLYVVFVFCFDGSADYNKYIYITWISLVAFIGIKMIMDLWNVKFYKEITLLIAYAVFCRASVLWAWNPNMAAERATTIIMMVVFVFCMVYYFTQRKNVDIIILAIAIAGVVLSLYVIITYGGLGAYYQQASMEGNRLGREINNENSIGMQCAYSVIMLFYMGFIKKKYIAYPFMVLPFLVAAGSGSRKSLVIMVMGIGLLLFLSQDDKKGSAIKLFKIVALLGAAVVAFWLLLKLPIMSTLNKRMGDFFVAIMGGEGDSSSMARMRMIEVGWEQFLKNPFFGIGVNNSGHINYVGTGRFTYLHNDYIEQLVCVGLFGFMLFYGVVISLLVKHIKLLKEKKPEIIISFVLLILFLINAYGAVWYYGKMTYLLFVLWISIVRINRDKLEKGVKNDDKKNDNVYFGKAGSKRIKANKQ